MKIIDLNNPKTIAPDDLISAKMVEKMTGYSAPTLGYNGFHRFALSKHCNCYVLWKEGKEITFFSKGEVLSFLNHSRVRKKVSAKKTEYLYFRDIRHLFSITVNEIRFIHKILTVFFHEFDEEIQKLYKFKRIGKSFCMKKEDAIKLFSYLGYKLRVTEDS